MYTFFFISNVICNIIGTNHLLMLCESAHITHKNNMWRGSRAEAAAEVQHLPQIKK